MEAAGDICLRLLSSSISFYHINPLFSTQKKPKRSLEFQIFHQKLKEEREIIDTSSR
jgi:hypothetical protein